MVGPPLWKIWLRKLGWLFTIDGKIKLMFQTTNQNCITLHRTGPTISHKNKPLITPWGAGPWSLAAWHVGHVAWPCEEIPRAPKIKNTPVVWFHIGVNDCKCVNPLHQHHPPGFYVWFVLGGWFPLVSQYPINKNGNSVWLNWLCLVTSILTSKLFRR